MPYHAYTHSLSLLSVVKNTLKNIGYSCFGYRLTCSPLLHANTKIGENKSSNTVWQGKERRLPSHAIANYPLMIYILINMNRLSLS